MQRAPKNILMGTVTAISKPRPVPRRISDVIPRTAKVVVTVDVGHGLTMLASIDDGPLAGRKFKLGDRVELEIPASSVLVRKPAAPGTDDDEDKLF